MKSEIVKIGVAALLLVALVLSGLLVLLSADTQLSLAAVTGNTGEVSDDFDQAINPDIVIIEDNGINGNPVGDVGIPIGGVSGWDMIDLRLFYDASADELHVGFNFDGIGGDSDGDGDPGSGPIPVLGGTDEPAFGAGESFALILDLDEDGTPDVIAGVNESGDITSFDVATAQPFAASLSGFSISYLTSIPGAIGTPPMDTSPARPDIIFSIAGFSTLPGSDASLNFGVLASAGAGSTDAGIGDELVPDADAFITVNLFTAEPAIDIEKTTNGFDADTADEGPLLEVGSIANFEYTVTNTGNVDLVDVTVTDNKVDSVDCPKTTLEVDEVMVCTATAVVILGDYMNTGTASGFQDDGTGNPVEGADPVTAEDPSHHTGAEGSIDLEKNVNGVDVDDPTDPAVPNVAVGSTITFDFIVTNTGSLDLDAVNLTDDVLGDITCPATTLSVGAEMTCSVDHVVTTEGLTPNTGSVTAQPVEPNLGIPFGDPVGDTDPAHHVGVVNSIDIEKATNGEDADDTAGPNVPLGDTVTFTYVVTNNSLVGVADVLVTDTVEGDICEVEFLAAGESTTCTAEISAGLGAYENGSSVSGQPVDDAGNPAGPPVTDEDPSHHFGVCATTFDGPVLYKGSQTVWDTGLVAADNSTMQVITKTNPGSPGQPNEQVYIEIAGVQYGPTPASLGIFTFDVETGGPVTVLHISEVDSDINGSNSVLTSLCGTDLVVAPPVCVDFVEGPPLYVGSETVWDTGLTAESGSIIRLVTTENGASPAQPNEQVYVEIAGTQYGPSPAGLGEIEIVVGESGPVTVLHYSVVTGDTSSPNSVVPALCGDGLTETPPPACTNLIEGPALWAGAETEWHTGLTAQAGSTLRIVTFENGASPAQPNEQVYIMVGEDQYGPSPAGLGEFTFTVDNTGPVKVLHYSVVTGDVSSPNSVVPSLCGTDLAPTPVLCSDFIQGPALWVGNETVWHTGLTAVAGEPIRVLTTENGASPAQPNEQVYVKIGDETYGPSPQGLGAFEFTPTTSGEVTVLHYSVVTGDTSSPNSVVPALCGPGLSVTPPACVDLVEGTVLYHGADTVWHTNYFAKDNSKIRVVVTENGASPDQPNEKVFVQINGETIGMTPSADGEATFDVIEGGPVSIVHYSVVTGDTSSSNSVVPSFCGTDIVKIEGGLSCELPDGTEVTVDLDGTVIPASFDSDVSAGEINALGSADSMADFVPGSGDTIGGLASSTSGTGFSLAAALLVAAVGAFALVAGGALGARRS